MISNLKTFENKNFGKLTVIEKDGEFFLYDGHVLMLGWNSLRSVVVDESHSDLQVSHGDMWERGSNSEIVAWRTGTEYQGVTGGQASQR